MLTVAATGVALLAGIRLLRIPYPRGDWSDAAFFVFLLVSMPQVHWLWAWWRGWR